jgi:hypothetical protein
MWASPALAVRRQFAVRQCHAIAQAVAISRQAAEDEITADASRSSLTAPRPIEHSGRN